DVGKKTLTIEISGVDSKIRAMLDLLKTFGIKEVIRTGKIAITREFK
ncbi:MAG: acetolactate synthase small subunit, partial [Candidatus Omnitrophica bacterium]|nr:acetolactate synthase small subunit [Candidatus Omnitrophota bacterium]